MRRTTRIGMVLTTGILSIALAPVAGHANQLDYECSPWVDGFGKACVRALNYATLSAEFPSIDCYTRDNRPVCFGWATVGAEAYVSSPYGGAVGAMTEALSGPFVIEQVGFLKFIPRWTPVATHSFAEYVRIPGYGATRRPQPGRTTKIHLTPEATGPTGGCLTYRAQWNVTGLASTRRHDTAGAQYVWDPETLITSVHRHTLSRRYCVQGK